MLADLWSGVHGIELHKPASHGMQEDSIKVMGGAGDAVVCEDSCAGRTSSNPERKLASIESKDACLEKESGIFAESKIGLEPDAKFDNLFDKSESNSREGYRFDNEPLRILGSKLEAYSNKWSDSSIV